METQKSRKPSKRSSSYPSDTINKCIDFVSQIYKTHGDSYFISREEIAKTFNQSAGSLQKRIGTCNQYDLLDLSVGQGYKPSSLFKKIFRPLNSNEVLEGKIECFRSPKLYQSLISLFEGSIVPTLDPLTNRLAREEYGLSDKAAHVAAKIFLENCEDLDLLDNENNLFLNPEGQNDSLHFDLELLVIDNLVTVENSDGQLLNETPYPITAVSEDRNYIQVSKLGESFIPISQINSIKPKSNDTTGYREGDNKNTLALVSSTQNENTSEKQKNEHNVDKEKYLTQEILLTNSKKAILTIPYNIEAKDLRVLKHQIDGIGLSLGVEDI
ncbi:hypothetical protein [Roseivirga pacifica]|uniref:hypothetical protein n=1 Tax=Roseivirga pacifica TaxID=1267423 RepID=UPI003BADB616